MDNIKVDFREIGLYHWQSGHGCDTCMMGPAHFSRAVQDALIVTDGEVEEDPLHGLQAPRQV
jgi:hypothetical protein